MGEGEATVVGEIGGSPRCSMRGEIVRRGAGDEAVRRQRAGDESVVVFAADPECEIDTLVDEIDIAIGEGDVHDDFGPGLHEPVQQRQNMEAAKGDRQIEPQPAARSLGPAHHGEFGVFQVRKNADAAPIEGLAFIRRRHASCGAVEKAHAELIFQTRHALAYSRARKPELFGSDREATGVGNADKGDDVSDAIQGHGEEIAHVWSPVKLQS